MEDLKEICFKDFSKKVQEITKEHNISAYLMWWLEKSVHWFSFENNIVVNKNKNIYEIIFATHHETWHIVLNHTTKTKETEREADNFACELLFDDEEAIEMLKENNSFYDLEREFWLPAKEILKRLKFSYKWTEIWKMLNYICL